MLPPKDERLSVRDVLKRHSGKIENQIKTSKIKNINYSKDYIKFKKEMAPDLTRYERWCQSLGKIIKLRIAEKDELRIKKQLDIAHIDLEPWQTLTLSITAFFTVFCLL